MCVCGETFQIINVKETCIPHAEKVIHDHGAFCFSIRGSALSGLIGLLLDDRELVVGCGMNGLLILIGWTA